MTLRRECAGDGCLSRRGRVTPAFTPDSLHDVRSVTKSVASILVGIAIEEGLIPSVEDPVDPYLRPVVDSLREEVAAVPIRSFLMMSSGLDWHELDRGTSYGDWWRSMGLRITARDMMRIGQMFLDGGMREDFQVVPAPWVAQSTTSHLPTQEAVPFGQDYGYLWWVGEGGGRSFYFANG